LISFVLAEAITVLQRAVGLEPQLAEAGGGGAVVAAVAGRGRPGGWGFDSPW